MRKGSIYKAKYNNYDVNDSDFYIFKIISDMKYNEIDQSPYYDSILLVYRGSSCEYRLLLYPHDWQIIEELSSLEKELF
jgi:hypothetical protein